MSPENDALPYATLGKRLMALVYDALVLLALSMAYSALATVVLVWVFHADNQGDYSLMHSGPWYGLGWLLTIAGFYWLFWKRGGQTVGMRAWRLKVVNEHGGAITHGQCWRRILCGPISLAVFGLGYVWCLFRRDRASWHDLASGTRVVVLPKLKKTTAPVGPTISR